LEAKNISKEKNMRRNAIQRIEIFMNRLKDKHPFTSNIIVSLLSFAVIGYTMSFLQLFFTEIGLGGWFGLYEELLTDWDSSNIIGYFIDITHAVFGIFNSLILMLIFVMVGYKRLVPFKKKYKNFISIWVTAFTSFILILTLFYVKFGSLNFEHINIQMFSEYCFPYLPTAKNFEWFAVYDCPKFLSANAFVLIFSSIVPSLLLSIGMLLNIKGISLNKLKVKSTAKTFKMILIFEIIISILPWMVFGAVALYFSFKQG